MKKRFLLLLLTLFLLCGCQEAEIDPDAVDFSACETIPIEDVQAFPLIDNALTGSAPAPDHHIPTEDGVFLLKLTQTSENSWSPDPAFLYYDDFASGEIYPVCTKSNCTHDSYDCNAYLPNAQYLHYDGEYIYYFTGTQPALWRMKPDGTDRKLIFKTTEDETSLPTILSAVYAGRKVYFPYCGAILNRETMEMESSEYICVGDLDTGELRTLPVRFQRNKNGSTLGLRGIYEDQLLLRHSLTVSEGMNYQKNEETLFLLDVSTCEITVLVRWTWDTGSDAVEIVCESAPERGLLLMQELTGETEESTYLGGGEAVLRSGNRILVDLSAGKAYRQSGLDDMSYWDRIIDNHVLLEHWSEDRSFVEEYALDLSTGVETPALWLPRLTELIPSYYAAGDYFLIYDYEDNGLPRHGKIKKEDYWAGKVDAIEYLPDWVLIS